MPRAVYSASRQVPGLQNRQIKAAAGALAETGTAALRAWRSFASCHPAQVSIKRMKNHGGWRWRSIVAAKGNNG
jgi:hypothetical protein